MSDEQLLNLMESPKDGLQQVPVLDVVEVLGHVDGDVDQLGHGALLCVGYFQIVFLVWNVGILLCFFASSSSSPFSIMSLLSKNSSTVV